MKTLKIFYDFLRIVKGLFYSIKFNLRFLVSLLNKKKVLIFQFHSASQLIHIEDLINAIQRDLIDFEIFFSTYSKEFNAVKKIFPKIEIFPLESIPWIIFYKIVYGLDQRMYFPFTNFFGKRIVGFHGQPTKGNSFKNVNRLFVDSYFAYGPAMIDEIHRSMLTTSILLKKIGQCKTDKIFNSKQKRFDKSKIKNILIAPSFEICSLFKIYEEQIINTNYNEIKYNITFLPHPSFYNELDEMDDFFRNTVNKENWKSIIKLLNNFNNVKFPVNLNERSRIELNNFDLIITDYSGITFESIYYNIPFGFVDCEPHSSNYFNIKYNVDPELFSNNFIISAGRKYGVVFCDWNKFIQELPSIDSIVKENDYDFEYLQKNLLYNRGNAIKTTLNEFKKV